MPNTYTQIHIQAVFTVQNRACVIQKRWQEELYRYITGIVQNHGHKVLVINGMPDHEAIRQNGLTKNSSFVADSRGRKDTVLSPTVNRMCQMLFNTLKTKNNTIARARSSKSIMTCWINLAYRLRNGIHLHRSNTGMIQIDSTHVTSLRDGCRFEILFLPTFCPYGTCQLSLPFQT